MAMSLIFLFVQMPGWLPAQSVTTNVTPTGGNTSAYKAGNGVTVVNIDKANANGLSHNKFTNYTVGQEGLVLNNGNLSQLERQSKLAGAVAANPNLDQQASLILNEVVSSNRSILAGFTEVLGGKADVIVANPNGITCSGCGFINTDRVTLTTGVPTFGIDGGLSGFNVSGGDLLVNGNGFNASEELSALKTLDLVARSIKLDAPINVSPTGSLQLVTGANAWDYTSRSVTGPVAPSGTVPTYAIDSSALGGMYAGRIRLIATEAGVGVRMLGEAAASADDFILNAAGKIIMQNKFSAERDLAITSTDTGADAISATDSRFSASRTLSFTATSGGLTLAGGALFAGNNLSYDLGTLSDVSTATVMTDNNKRYAGNDFTMTTSGAASLAGVKLGAAGLLDGDFNSLLVGSDTTLYGNDVILNAFNSMQYNSSSTVQATNSMTLGSANDSISNNGLLLSNKSMGMTASSITNTSTIRAADSLTLEAASGGITNSGLMISDNSLELTAASIANTSTIKSAGKMTINATSGAIDNSGLVLSENNLDMTASASITNTSTIRATDTLTLDSANGAVSNSGMLLAGNALGITATSITNTSTGGIAGLGTLEMTATTGDIQNAGTLYAGTQLTAHSDSGTFTNADSGTMRSDGSLTLTAGTFVNNNWVEAAQDVAITTTTAFRNEIQGGLPSKYYDWTNALISVYTTIHDQEESGCIACNHVYVYEDIIDVAEKFTGATPPSDAAKNVAIVSGHNLTVNYGAGTADNIGAVLSAQNNLTIAGTGAFTNQSIFLDTHEYKRHWMLFINRAWDDSIDDYAYVAAGTDAQHDGIPYFSGTDSDLTYPGGAWSVYGGTSYNQTSETLFNKARDLAHKKYIGVVDTETIRSATVRAAGTITINGTTVASQGSAYSGSVKGVITPTDPPSIPNITATLPTNPNGLFVPATDPSAHYLVVTNPLYGLGTGYSGSNYLLERLGLNPDETLIRLGDATYEAYLMRKQLVSETGSSLLKGYASEEIQMKALMDNAAGQAKSLGLTVGKSLTPEQVAGLKQDIVWLEEVTVDGKKALAPRVYLSQASRDMIVSGATIAAENVKMDVTSLSNTGGTISGSKSIDVTSKGDIANISGTIKGGDVSLKSTEGSIVNKTAGGVGEAPGTIGKTATIAATGDLNLDANKDITVKGGEVKAGGDASLSAGGAITFDTVVKKDATYATDGTTNSSVVTEKNIGSTLSAGKNLKLKSGGDTTVAGSKVEAGGNLTVDAGGDFNVLSRQDKKTTETQTSKSGIGVGGGLWGTEQTTVTDFEGKNVGSSIKAGGDADIKAGKDMTLQGSDLKVAGNATIDATSVKILDGLDEKRTVTKVETQTFLKPESSSDSGASAAASSVSSLAADQATANAEATAGNESELSLYEKRTTTTDYSKKTSVGSNLTTGGDLTIKAKDKLTVQGSNVESGKDLSIEAKSSEILTGRNEETTTTTTKATKIGIFSDSAADAKAGAEANNNSDSASNSANASAKANAESTVTFGVRHEESTDETKSTTNTASTLKSGGNMNLKVQEEAKFVGAKVESGKNMNIEAKDITNLAAQDTATTTHNKTTTTAGVYLSGKASAEAEAGAKLGIPGASAKASAKAEAEASAGLRAAHEKESSETGSITNVVTSFKAGGDITNKASGTITNQGTQIEAGGNITQTATTLKDLAAEDKTWSKSSSEKHDARIGVYAGAGAEAGANAQAGLGADAGTKAEADASAGLKASYTFNKASQESTETKAVVTKYKAGGNISSTATEGMTLTGTQFEAGKDVTISAKSLDYQAAHDTSSSSSSSKNAAGEVKVKLAGTAGADVSGSYGQNDSSASSSTAKVGGIKAGGNLTITTQNDARLEGTDIAAGGNAKVESKSGNVTFDAAKSTTSESSKGFDANLKVSVGKDSKSAGLGGGYAKSSSESTTNKGVNIKAGNVDISAGKSVTMEGATVNAKGDTTVNAGGDVKLLEAKDTSKSSAFGIKGNVKVSKSTKSGKDAKKKNKDKDAKKGKTDAKTTTNSQSGNITVKVQNEDKQTGKATKLQSGGNLTIKGNSITSQEADLSAGGQKTVDGPVQNLQKTNIDKGVNVNIDADFVHKKKTDDSKNEGKKAK